MYTTKLVRLLYYYAYLIHNILDVDWLQYLGFNHSMQISVHELKHQVDVLVIASSDDIQQLYHVLVRGKLLQNRVFRSCEKQLHHLLWCLLELT